MKKIFLILLCLIASICSAQPSHYGPYDPGAMRTGNIALAATGTAAAPAYSFGSDPNTGIYSPAADTLAFAEGGAESFRVNSAGEVLIATSTDAGAYPLQNNGYLWSRGYDLPRDTRIGWASKIDVFTLNGVSTAQNGLTHGPTVGDYVTLAGYYGLNFVSGSLERMRITQVGNVLVATSTDDGANKLQVNGNAWFSADVSALSFTDRTPAPKDLEESYAIINSHEIESGELNHRKLHPAAWGMRIRQRATGRRIEKMTPDGEKELVNEVEEIEEPDQSKRNLSITITAQALVIKDLIKRIEVLEETK